MRTKFRFFSFETELRYFPATQYDQRVWIPCSHFSKSAIAYFRLNKTSLLPIFVTTRSQPTTPCYQKTCRKHHNILSDEPMNWTMSNCSGPVDPLRGFVMLISSIVSIYSWHCPQLLACPLISSSTAPTSMEPPCMPRNYANRSASEKCSVRSSKRIIFKPYIDGLYW